MDEAEVADILPLISTRAASLNAPIGTDGATFGETLVDNNINQFDKLERTRNSEAIAAAVVDFSNNLKDKQRAIFNGRILAEYLGNDKVSANDFGVSKQRVGQIEKDLTAKLRNHLTNRGLGL